MKASPKLFGALLLLPPAVSAQSVYPELVIVRNTSSSGTSWSATPFIFADEAEAIISSPTGNSGASTSSGSYSSGFATFSDMAGEATGSPWQLTLHPSGTPSNHTFGVTFPGLDEPMFAEVLLIQPSHLNAVAPGANTIIWSGPASAGWIDFILQRDDFSLVTYQSLAPMSTSHTLAAALDPGAYRLTIRYVTSLAGEVVLSEPVETGSGLALSAATGYGWEPQVSLWSQGSYTFFVIPEPAALSLTLLGGMALCRRRRHVPESVTFAIASRPPGPEISPAICTR